MSNVFFKVVVNFPPSSGERQLKKIARASPDDTLLDFLLATIGSGRRADDISSVKSRSGFELVPDMLDAGVGILADMLEEDASKALSLTVQLGDAASTGGTVSASASSGSGASSSATSSDDPEWQDAENSERKKKKRRARARADGGGNKEEEEEKRRKKNNKPSAGYGCDLDARHNSGVDTSNDAALAWELANSEAEHVAYHEYVEGGRTFEARVIGHAALKNSLKFLVEWRKKAATAPPPPAASTLQSSSSSSSGPAMELETEGGEQGPRIDVDPLCTSWFKLEELIAPSAALRYLESTRYLDGRRMPPWVEDAKRKEIEKFSDQLKRDNTFRQDPNESQMQAIGEIDFCCYLCHCGGREAWNPVTKCGVISKYHRACCCHGLGDNQVKLERFRSSLGIAQEKLENFIMTKLAPAPQDSSTSSSESDSDEETISPSSAHAKRRLERHLLSTMKSRTSSARSRETRSDNDLQLPAPDSQRWTDENAVNVHRDFHRILKERESNPNLKRRAVVLDVFAGIGCGEVALKRLGIDISRVVVVEHDRVAESVYRYNHDHLYGGVANDEGIEYVFSQLQTFEELIENLHYVVREYGPFDLIIGGPPCQAYSKVNAFRKGVDGDTGRYMRDFATLISNVRKLNEQLHGFKDLFFLAENVPGAEDVGKYGVSEFRCDASLFGPCHRDRVFFFNWQPNPTPEDEHPSGASRCFSNGWKMPTMFHKNIDSKSMTLLASKSRTKDVTLNKWRVLPGKEVGPGEDRPATHGEYQLFDTNDRERLMGLPVAYVSAPIAEIFLNLRRAFTVGQEANTEWRDVLHPKYWNFLHLGPENYTFSVDMTEDVDVSERICLSLKDWNQRTKICLKEYEYAWHLIGNGYSIPQVMYLLKPLQQLFKRKVYAGYTDAKFAWEEDNAEEANGLDFPVKREESDLDKDTVSYDSSDDERSMNGQRNL